MGAEETKERILAAAAEGFSARGFDGTSTRTVGQAAGANIATIAYHFGGKEGLYHAVLGRMYGRILSFEPQPEGADAEQRLRSLMHQLWRFCRSEQTAVRLLLRHVVQHGSLPAPVQQEWAPKSLAKALELQELLGVDDLFERRLSLLSLNHLLGRYAIQQGDDLAAFVGQGDVDEALGAHLGDVAVRLLLG